MPDNATIVILILGAILVLVGILGGNFEIFGAKVGNAVSNRRLRLASFLIGTTICLIVVLQPIVPQILQSISERQPSEETNTSSTISSSMQMSIGDKLLVEDEANQSDCLQNVDQFNAFKEAGIRFMDDAVKNPNQASRYYGNALNSFIAAKGICNNAPETLIYEENARVGSNEAYVIAVPVPITEPNPEDQPEPGRALMMLRGFAQAQHEINDPKERINDKPLKLMLIDDKDNEDTAKEIALQLSKNRDVYAVMGHWRSNVSESAAKIYRSQSLVFVTPISIFKGLSDYFPWVFRINATSAEGASKLAEYVEGQQTLNDKKVLIFFDSSLPYGEELRATFRKAITAGRILDQIDLQDYQSDQHNEEKLQEAIRDEHILALFPGPSTVDIALSIVQNNGTSVPLILGDMANLYTGKTLEESASRGMILAPSWNIDSDPDSSFTKGARQLWGGRDVSWAAAMSYNAAQVLIEAIKKSGDQDNIRSGIQQAIVQEDFVVPNGVPKEIRFSREGNADIEAQLVQVCLVEEPQEKLKFIPIDQVSSKCKS